MWYRIELHEQWEDEGRHWVTKCKISNRLMMFHRELFKGCDFNVKLHDPFSANFLFHSFKSIRVEILLRSKISSYKKFHWIFFFTRLLLHFYNTEMCIFKIFRPFFNTSMQKSFMKMKNLATSQWSRVTEKNIFQIVEDFSLLFYNFSSSLTLTREQYKMMKEIYISNDTSLKLKCDDENTRRLNITWRGNLLITELTSSYVKD